MSGRKAFLALVYGQMLLRPNAKLLIFYLFKYISSDILLSPPLCMTYIIKIRESILVCLLEKGREEERERVRERNSKKVKVKILFS